MQSVIPAIIPQSVEHVSETLERLMFASTIQLDLVDSVFATPASWPYEPKGEPRELESILAPFDVGVDCMVADGLQAARAWHAVGVRRFIFHLEAIEDGTAVDTFRAECDCTVGFSIANNTPIEMLTDQIDSCDFVQLMGIAEIGTQGQPFDERVLSRIAQLRTDFPHLTISIDGSVNKDTLPRLREAGANRFVAGSAILNAMDPKEAYDALCALAN